MSDFDSSKLDIFESANGSTFNACIGTNSLHDIQTYAEGYLQASQKLLEAMFEHQLYYERDTLVHPILYSARHGIELSIKHVLSRLGECDVKTDEKKLLGHSLRELWVIFEETLAFDRRFYSLLGEVKNIVIQLDSADPDAQDFRYPKNSQGEKTLEGKVIVDLVTTKKVVEFLQEKILELFRLTETILEERLLSAFTPELNREELKELSIDLPVRENWSNSAEFKDIKKKWMDKLGLSNKAFSRAISFIEKHREFSANIGLEIPLQALTTDVVRKVVLEAYEVQKVRRERRCLGLHERMQLDNPVSLVFSKLKDALSKEVIADINSLFYLSRDRYFSEKYEMTYLSHLKEFEGLTGSRLIGEKNQSFNHVFSKTNFLDEFLGGLRLVGQITLVDELDEYNIKEEFDVEMLEL
jgi:hypothetical protein